METPEQLDAWIAQAPAVKASLEKDGYGTAFTSHDLLPLLQAFVVQAGGPTPAVEAPAPSSRGRWVALSLVFAVILLLLALATGAIP